MSTAERTALLMGGWMRRYVTVVIVVTLACWTAEGLTTSSWPIGAIGTGIASLGLGFAAFMWWIKHQATLTREEYERQYLDRKVAQHQDGNIIG